MRSIRRRDSGFTLIEILLALVILMIGIVGIISLFPVAIKNTSDSVEDSTAANICQSLYNAMVEAMRRPNTKGDVVLTHDGLQKVGPQTYTFTLPATIGTTALHPSAGMGTDPTLQVFQLGHDSRQDLVISDIQAPASGLGGDPTEPTRQYSYQFEVTKPPEAIVTLTAGATTTVPLYQFRFMIYRNYSIQVYPPDEQHPDLVKDFTTLIAGTGL